MLKEEALKKLKRNLKCHPLPIYFRMFKPDLFFLYNLFTGPIEVDPPHNSLTTMIRFNFYSLETIATDKSLGLKFT